MSANPYVRPFACSRCRDLRVLAGHASARRDDLVKCPACGEMPAEEYADFRRRAWAFGQPQPEITAADLSPVEFAEYRKLRAEHPETSGLTVLSWIEGRRYDPEKDPDVNPDLRAEQAGAA